jgi:LmbE family N-acetylglucosaminyl deacetylase
MATDLPAPRDWDLSSPRVREASTVLSGATVISSWAKSITNARPTYSQDMPDATFQKLDALDRHATQTTWVLAADSRTFLVEIDVTKAERITRNGQPYRAVEMAVQIIEER